MPSRTIIYVDARGLRCPLPVLRLRKAAEGQAGALIELVADDPAADRDVPTFVREKGWSIEASGRDGEVRRWSVRVRSVPTIRS